MDYVINEERLSAAEYIDFLKKTDLHLLRGLNYITIWKNGNLEQTSQWLVGMEKMSQI